MLKKRGMTKEIAQNEVDGIYGKGVWKVVKLKITKEKKLMKLEAQCTRCNSSDEYSYTYFLRSNQECMCKNDDGLRKMATKYADVLFIEPDKGLLLGKDLTDYVKSCVAYDMPFLGECTEFIEYIEDAMLDIYESKNAKQCIRCKKYFPKSRLSYRGLCRCCKGGI